VATSPGIAEQYRFAVDSFIELARTFDDDEWATPVPCTPGWTVRDVLSHVSGIPDDAAAGRMDGVASEPWTAAQVERNRGFGADELLERWTLQTPAFASVIEQMGQGRPAIDCHSHEHDIRHALGRPGARSNSIVESESFATVDAPVRVIVEFAGGRRVVSGSLDAADTVVLRGATAFELFRSRLGRRSRAQVRAYDWDGADRDVECVIDRWFGFGPSSSPIVE
jgi:uncharacterized protein (TIGR03083 family)